MDTNDPTLGNMIKCAYCGRIVNMAKKKHVCYQSQDQPGKPRVVWCVDPDCWRKDPFGKILLKGPWDKVEERICLAHIQARGPGRLSAGQEWWGPQYKK